MSTKTKIRNERFIEDYDRIRLNGQARDVFLNALANPPVPGEKLRRAADKFTAK